MLGQASSSFDRQQLRAIMQGQASRTMAAASDQAAVKELAVETLLDPNYVTPIGLTITPDGDGGVMLEVIGSGGGGGSLVAVRGEIPTGAINGSNMAYTLAHAPFAGASVFYNGLRLSEDQFTLLGSALTFSFAPETGASLRSDYEY